MSLSLQNSQVSVFAGFIRVVGVDALRTACLQTMQPCTSEPRVSSHWTAIPACVVLWCFHPSHPSLPLALHVTHRAGLEFLELNLVHGGEVSWERLAALPALHSLMLVPPISPHSSGHGPEHAQQVCWWLHLYVGWMHACMCAFRQYLCVWVLADGLWFKHIGYSRLACTSL
jgi:hypothetical protein